MSFRLTLENKSHDCAHPLCHEATHRQCECCDNYFCTDHGSKGGDHDTDYGAVAYPAMCWACGGFNCLGRHDGRGDQGG